MKGLTELKLLGQGLVLQTLTLLPHEAICVCPPMHKIWECEMYTWQEPTFSNLGGEIA